MRAAVLYGPRDLRMEEVHDPQPAADEIVYRVMACGVCPSDVRRWSGSRAGDEKRVLGHESVGEVIEVGNNVEGFAVGDRVARDWRDTCGECAYCRKGLFNFCLRAETPARLGFMGGFCELSKARGAACRRIPEDLAYEEAAFSEPLACCINGIRQSRVDLGEDVAVLGCGPIGLQLLQLARMRGARVIAVDLEQERLETARASMTVVPNKEMTVVGPVIVRSCSLYGGNEGGISVGCERLYVEPCISTDNGTLQNSCSI